jgi:hypothetical protein
MRRSDPDGRTTTTGKLDLHPQAGRAGRYAPTLVVGRLRDADLLSAFKGATAAS